VEQIKDSLNKKKQKLLDDEKALSQIKDKISPTINNSDYEVNIAEKKYQMHDQYSLYNANERKLAELESKRYYLRQYINTKSKDINYEDIKNECMSYADELNKKLVK
jgi:intraflagellar transport protein 74